MDEVTVEEGGPFANTFPSLSTFFRKGLGRFSSSARSYFGAGWVLGAGTGTGITFVVVAGAGC